MKLFDFGIFIIVHFAVLPSVIAKPRHDSSNVLLISAVEKNDELQVRSLIEEGANVNFRKSCELCVEYMPLHIAAKRGNAKIVELLIKNGAEIDGLSELPKDFHGTIPAHKDTPLIVAAENNHIDIVEMLIKAVANINRKRHFRETALYVASEKGYDRIVETLIKNGANVNEANYIKNTPLNSAAEHDYFRVAELLINAGADLNVLDGAGYTPLNTAALHGNNTEVAKLLIEKYADIKIKTSEYNFTPLYWSTFRGNDQLSVLLIENGADVNAADKGGTPSLQNAAINGSVEVVDLLIKHGANVNQKDEMVKLLYT